MGRRLLTRYLDNQEPTQHAPLASRHTALTSLVNCGGGIVNLTKEETELDTQTR